MDASFDEYAKHALLLAGEEARNLYHTYVGTGHLLLGLSRGNAGSGAVILQKIGIDYQKIRSEVIKLDPPPENTTTGDRPSSPRLMRVLQLASREAASGGKINIGTEHLLLAIALEGEGIGFRVLSHLGIDADHIRNWIRNCRDLEPRADNQMEV
ncbi:MAG: hypothetical protein JXA73_12935 [Acidobacteria bacterium]|nr:hypothetical protein [Acidobacteriota bacterium]